MAISYNDTLSLAVNFNDVMKQTMSSAAALAIADFAVEVQKIIENFEGKRAELIKLQDEEEKEREFINILSQEVELPQFKLSAFPEVKVSPALVVFMRRLNLW